MKVCDNCLRVNLDDAEKCLGCGEAEFIPILDPAFYDSGEEYQWKRSDVVGDPPNI